MTEKDKMKCKYIFPNDYNPKYVNGAQGGISLQGEIVINFYHERLALPNSQTFEVSSNGLLGNEVQALSEPRDLKESFVRFIQGGVVVNYPAAKEIHRWLGENLKILEDATKKGI
jgi:hypothetical protein